MLQPTEVAGECAYVGTLVLLWVPDQVDYKRCDVANCE